MTTPKKPFSRQAEAIIGEFRGVPLDEPARMRKRDTREIGELLEDIRVKHRIGRSGPEDAVREAWPELVGAANAVYSHPVRIEGKRLIVAATHSVVRNELFLNRAEIVRRVQQLPSSRTVTDLHIIAG
ncbi:MAG: DUF721 domain-containing protein [Opitutaceae bacterium]